MIQAFLRVQKLTPFLFPALILVLLGEGASRINAQVDDNRVLAPHKPIAPKVNLPIKGKRYPKPVSEPRSLVGGPWMLDPNMKSTLYITNGNETDGVSATPILYLSNGVKVALPVVTLGPAATATVNLGEALAHEGIAPYAELRGYVELEYSSFYDPLCATVVSVDSVHSVIFTYPFRPTSAAVATLKATGLKIPSNEITLQRVDGVWWKRHAAVTGFVSLSNTTSRWMAAQVQVVDNEGAYLGQYPVSLSPHATQTVSLAELQRPSATAGGIELTYTAPPGSILVGGGLVDLATGYSAAIPFRPHAPITSAIGSNTTTLTELGLMTGAPDPMMLFPAGTEFTPFSVIRNVSSAQVVLTPELFWMDQGSMHRQTGSAITIKESETQSLDMQALLDQTGLGHYNGVLNVTFQTAAPSGSLIVASGSVDRTGTYVFQIQPHAMSESASKAISYWSVANGDDTMVSVWNPADESQDFQFTLQYGAGGRYITTIHLEPRASRFFNISSLIKDQIPDIQGHVIPTTVTEGSARVSGIHAENERILVGIDAGTYNVRKATCAYYCITCDGATYSVIGTPIDVPVTFESPQSYLVYQNTGGYYDYSYNASWTSSNASIASFNSPPIANGNLEGSFTATASVSDIAIYNSDYCAYNPECSNNGSMEDSENGNVTDSTPVLTGVDPGAWPSGAVTPGVVFSGQNFGTNPPTLNFSPSTGITYTVTSSNDTQIVANVSVAAGTPNEDVQVSVTGNGYNGNSFQSGGGAVSPTGAPVHVTIRVPLNAPRVTVIGWIDGTQPDLATLPSGANSSLTGALNGSAAVCFLTLVDWGAGIPDYLYTSTDTTYANAWLLSRSANSPPPSTIDPDAIYANRDAYRLFNDWGGGSFGLYQVGNTIDPCNSGAPQSVRGGAPSQYMGQEGISLSGNLLQLAEGRAGLFGQIGYQTVNNGRTLPFIWSAIEFTPSGAFVSPQHEIFPTYTVYVNGQQVSVLTQSAWATFLQKDQSNEVSPSQVP